MTTEHTAQAVRTQLSRAVESVNVPAVELIFARGERAGTTEPAGCPSRSRSLLGSGRRKVAVGATAAAAVAAAAFAVSSTQTAAAWSAVPDAVPAAKAASLAAQCTKAIKDAHLPLAAPQARPAVAEQRGDFTSVLLTTANPNRVAICLANSSGHNSWALKGIYNVSPSTSTLTIAATPSVSGPGKVTAIFGRVSPNTQQVTVRNSAGQKVTASTSHGMYLAWWPSMAAAQTVTAVTSNGSSVTKTPESTK